jgi:hypothetical protein
MRTMVLAATAAVVLAGCASSAVQRSEAPQPKPGTALAFNVGNAADFKDGQTRAAEWCRETYDAPAQYVGEHAGPTGKVAVFGCQVK